MKSDYSKVNEELNSLPIWINTSCINCERKYPETIINIEGILHHNTKSLCLDIKKCNKFKNKKK